MESFQSKIVTITISQFWWIAIWGISFFIIEYIAGTSKHIELSLYIVLLIVVMGILSFKPHLMNDL